MDLKKVLVITLVLVVTFLAGKYSSKPEVKIEKVEVEKVVLKEVEKRNVKTVTAEKIKPDGTVIKKTTTLDLSQTDTNLNKDTKTQETRIEKNKPQWLIGGGVGYYLTDGGQFYSGEVNTRILSLPAFIGVQVNTGNKGTDVMAKILVEF